MISSFSNKDTQELFDGGSTRGIPPEIIKSAERKLDMINAATDIKDLRSPPGLRLEQLKGAMRGYWSIRVNDQWRITFKWSAPDATEVLLVDYRH
jgi:proteic killer suppression protein